MNKALKKYKTAKYRETRLCFLNWTIERLVNSYDGVSIKVVKRGKE